MPAGPGAHHHLCSPPGPLTGEIPRCGVWGARSWPSAPPDGCITAPQRSPKCPLSTAALQPRRAASRSWESWTECHLLCHLVPSWAGCLGAFATKERSGEVGQGAEFNLCFVKWQRDHCEGRWARAAPWGLRPPPREGLSQDSAHWQQVIGRFCQPGQGRRRVWHGDGAERFWPSSPSPLPISYSPFSPLLNLDLSEKPCLTSAVQAPSRGDHGKV